MSVKRKYNRKDTPYRRHYHKKGLLKEQNNANTNDKIPYDDVMEPALIGRIQGQTRITSIMCS